jgi:UPF0716 family protein affecting phage T7 exclusion
MTRIPLVLLAGSLAGIAWFSQRLGLLDTIAMLACGAVAGASLASLAARRRTR